MRINLLGIGLALLLIQETVQANEVVTNIDTIIDVPSKTTRTFELEMSGPLLPQPKNCVTHVPAVHYFPDGGIALGMKIQFGAYNSSDKPSIFQIQEESREEIHTIQQQTQSELDEIYKQFQNERKVK